MSKSASAEELRHKLAEMIMAQQRSIDVLQGWIHSHGGVTVEEPETETGSRTPSECSECGEEATRTPFQIDAEERARIIREYVKPRLNELKIRQGDSDPLSFPFYWVQLKAVLRSIGFEGFARHFERDNFEEYGSPEEDKFIKEIIRATVSAELDVWLIEDLVRDGSGTSSAGRILNELRRVVTGQPAGALYYRTLFALPRLENPWDPLTNYFQMIDTALWSCKWSGVNLMESEITSILLKGIGFADFEKWVRQNSPKLFLFSPFTTVDEFKAKLAEYVETPRNCDELMMPSDNVFREVMENGRR